MGQEVFINFDVEDLKNARCRGADDLRTKKFAQFIAGDSTVYDLFLTGTSGLLNIQDYAAIRMGVGNLNQRPESGTYTIAGTETLQYNHGAEDLQTAIEAITGASCTVAELTPFVFRVTFDSFGEQLLPEIDSEALVPASSVTVSVLTEGDGTTKEQWLWRVYRNALAFTDTFTNISGQGVQATLSLSTPGIYDLLASGKSVSTNFEVEVTDSLGNIQTIAQIPITLNGEVIGTGFEGTVPSARKIGNEAINFLSSFPDATINDKLTILANKTPNENATLALVDKTTRPSMQGGLRKIDDSLYIGPDESQQWIFTIEGEEDQIPVMQFPQNGGLRFANGNASLSNYARGGFSPQLESDDGSVVQTVYNTRQASYERIGNTVQINILISIDNFDPAWKSSLRNWTLTGFPFASDGINRIEVIPLRGWLDQGAANITGELQNNEDFMSFKLAQNFGTTAGAGNNSSPINSTLFATHPFNFSSGSFEFIVTGFYSTLPPSDRPDNLYLRPDGNSVFFQPDGESYYIQP